MRWFVASWRKLKDLGVLGINRRNAEFILDYNPRSLYPLVDDKLRMRDLCHRIGVPTPEVYASISAHCMLRRFLDRVGDREDFVIKPTRGAAGRGLLVIARRSGQKFMRSNGE